MTTNESRSASAIPDANVKNKSQRISAVWVIPIVAALIGAWLVFKTAIEEKVLIEVTFKNAEGIEAGKTVVKFHNVKIGVVKEVNFSDDLSNIVVVLEFKGIDPKKFTESTRFWVVKPRIGIGGISGLDTLLSGAYIEIDPGLAGEPVLKFLGMEEPGNYQLGNPGTTYLLKAKRLGSLDRRSPVKFRDIQVGFVTSYRLSQNNDYVEVEIFVKAPFDTLVEDETRFWDISGIDIQVGTEGVEVDLESFATMMSGGVAFSTSDKSTGIQAKEKTLFTLHATEKKRFAEVKHFEVPMKLYFGDGVGGLDVGAPVDYKGLRLGTVTDIAVEVNHKSGDLLTYAMVAIEPERLPKSPGITKMSDSERTNVVNQFFENQVNKGLRAQLKTGSLLTGKTLVSFDIFPDAKKESLKYDNNIAVLPTVPDSLSGIIQSVNNILDRIDALPIGKIGSNVAGITENINDLPLKEISDNVRGITEKINALPLGTIAADVDKMTKSINALAESFNASEGGMTGEQLNEVMLELSKAARSLRGLTEYLERHPEALLKGKVAEE